MLKKNPRKNGYVLIITILITSLMLFLGMYLGSLSITENTIAHSHAKALQSYYLAEAGLHDMIFKIQNDIDGYGTAFETNASWNTSFTRSNPFDSNTSYDVTITNSDKAYGEISATGFVDLSNGTTAQRIVKITIFKALGNNVEDWENKGALANGNIDISLSNVNFLDGDAFSNNNFTVNGSGSNVHVYQDLVVVNNYLKAWDANVVIDGMLYAANNTPPNPATEVQMPAIDFDSAAATSYKNTADVVYTEQEFSDLMFNNPDLTLNNPITYVDGDVDILGGQNLTLNGLLVVGNDLEIGKKECWQTRCGVNNITINHVAGTATGIFAKRKIDMYAYTGTINATGLIYANDEIILANIPVSANTFDVYGAIFSRKLTITSCWQDLNIHYDQEVVTSAFSISPFSSIITVEHWEEDY